MAMAERSSQPPSLIPSLPHDVMINILARVSRSDYPTLSLVSKHFRSLVASPEVYATRSLLECKEHCLYVVLYNHETRRNHSYILCNRRLVLVSSLPALQYDSSFVVVGSRIYVFGLSDEDNMIVSIDCGSHTVQPLPSIPVPISFTMANIIDKRIYAIGLCLSDLKQITIWCAEISLERREGGEIWGEVEWSNRLAPEFSVY